MSKLRGNKKQLLEYIATNGQVSLSAILNKIYEEKQSAKDAVQEFEDEGWIEVKGYGNFRITNKGAERYKKMKRGTTIGSRQGDEERRLDTFGE